MHAQLNWKFPKMPWKCWKAVNCCRHGWLPKLIGQKTDQCCTHEWFSPRTTSLVWWRGMGHSTSCHWICLDPKDSTLLCWKLTRNADISAHGRSPRPCPFRQHCVCPRIWKWHFNKLVMRLVCSMPCCNASRLTRCLEKTPHSCVKTLLRWSTLSANKQSSWVSLNQPPRMVSEFYKRSIRMMYSQRHSREAELLKPFLPPFHFMLIQVSQVTRAEPCTRPNLTLNPNSSCRNQVGRQPNIHLRQAGWSLCNMTRNIGCHLSMVPSLKSFQFWSLVLCRMRNRNTSELFKSMNPKLNGMQWSLQSCLPCGLLSWGADGVMFLRVWENVVSFRWCNLDNRHGPCDVGWCSQMQLQQPHFASQWPADPSWRFCGWIWEHAVWCPLSSHCPWLCSMSARWGTSQRPRYLAEASRLYQIGFQAPFVQGDENGMCGSTMLLFRCSSNTVPWHGWCHDLENLCWDVEVDPKANMYGVSTFTIEWTGYRPFAPSQVQVAAFMAHWPEQCHRTLQWAVKFSQVDSLTIQGQTRSHANWRTFACDGSCRVICLLEHAQYQYHVSNGG